MIAFYLFFGLFGLYNIGFLALDFFAFNIEPMFYFAGVHTLLSPLAIIFFQHHRKSLPFTRIITKPWWRSWLQWLPGLLVWGANVIILGWGLAKGQKIDFLSWTFVLVVIWVPMVEEIVFRMGVLTALARRFREPGLLIYLGALLFMLVHGAFTASGMFWPSLSPFWGAALLGGISGLIFMSGHRLAPVIFLHAACNATGYIFPWLSAELIEPIRWLYQ